VDYIRYIYIYIFIYIYENIYTYIHAYIYINMYTVTSPKSFQALGGVGFQKTESKERYTDFTNGIE
jgi:hypothetical protein